MITIVNLWILIEHTLYFVGTLLVSVLIGPIDIYN